MNAYYAQGARCGHLEGSDRVGQYVIGEEVFASWVAADAQGYDVKSAKEWAAGYQCGYRLAIEDNDLPGILRDWELPR